jgi:hypothetical protein
MKMVLLGRMIVAGSGTAATTHYVGLAVVEVAA